MGYDYENTIEFKRLKRRLDLPLWQACGLVEQLIRVTAQATPKGDIGFLADDEIAAVMEWRGDPDELITVLVECGWLLSSVEHRLIVANWPELSPERVRKKLRRAKQTFVTGPHDPRGTALTSERGGPILDRAPLRLAAIEPNRPPPTRPAAKVGASDDERLGRRDAVARSTGAPASVATVPSLAAPRRAQAWSGRVQPVSSQGEPIVPNCASALQALKEEFTQRAPRGASELSVKENATAEERRPAAFAREEVARLVKHGRTVEQLLADAYFEWAAPHQRRLPGRQAQALKSDPDATPERIAYLIFRVQSEREKVRNPLGFIFKGVQDRWEVPAEFTQCWRSLAAPASSAVAVQQAVNRLGMYRSQGPTPARTIGAAADSFMRGLAAAGG